MVTKFWRFSRRTLTPSGWAKALRCSMAVREFSRARRFQGSSLRPRWRVMAVRGICSADSEGTPDFVHSGDAMGLFGVDEVEIWRYVARPLECRRGRRCRWVGGGWRRCWCRGTTRRGRGRWSSRCSRSGGGRRRAQWFERRRYAGRRAGRGAGVAGGRRGWRDRVASLSKSTTGT